MESYIVRIYRGEKNDPRCLVGIVEEVGVEGKRAFTDLEELWGILNSIKNRPRHSKENEPPLVTYEYQVERRDDMRMKIKFPFAFIYGERNLEASTVDVCRRGFCIKIPEIMPLTVGGAMNLRMSDSDIEAEVRWLDHNPDPPITRIGFQIMNGKLNIKGLK